MENLFIVVSANLQPKTLAIILCENENVEPKDTLRTQVTGMYVCEGS